MIWVALQSPYFQNKQMYTKPLYEAEKHIQLQRHLDRLKKIAVKRVENSSSRNTIQQMHKVRHRSTQFQIRENSASISNENTKILNKLLEISERKDVPIYSTIASHVPKQRPYSIAVFNNPERKRRQMEINQSNNKLAQRLLTKESQFDIKKARNSITEYENVRKILNNNRKVRLLPMIRADGNGYDFNRVSTTQNSRAHAFTDNQNWIDETRV